MNESDNRSTYDKQVKLLLRVLPTLEQTPEFALKGGTAINLFFQDMPRLSVDIDLTYLPTANRGDAIEHIVELLNKIKSGLTPVLPDAEIEIITGHSPKLFIRSMNAMIKVEPNIVIRGSLLPPVRRVLSKNTQSQYEVFIEVQCLDKAELYAGKLCAALDRQHPRDLFDLLALKPLNEISELTRQTFVAYLTAHPRPISELLTPNRKPIKIEYENQFVGMTHEPIALDVLENVRTELFNWVRHALSEKERKFLLSIKMGNPEWSLMPFQSLASWPAVQWKLQNIHKMNNIKHQQAVDRLKGVLQL